MKHFGALFGIVAIFFPTCCLLSIPDSCSQPTTAPPAVAEAYSKIEKVVTKQYPKATIKRENGNLVITFNTRKFMVHNRLKTGEWQEAVEQEGPDRGGTICSVSAAPGRWMGAAVVPQTFDYRYYRSLLMAPYSTATNYHLTVHLNYPDDVQPSFLKEFGAVVSSFGDER